MWGSQPRLRRFLHSSSAYWSRVATEISIALAIVVLAVLSKKRTLSEFRRHVEGYELEATLKLLVITFIVLPILPRQPLDHYLTFAMGTVESVDTAASVLAIELAPGQIFETGQEVEIYEEGGRSLGKIAISEATVFRVAGTYRGDELNRLKPELEVSQRAGHAFSIRDALGHCSAQDLDDCRAGILHQLCGICFGKGSA